LLLSLKNLWNIIYFKRHRGSYAREALSSRGKFRDRGRAFWAELWYMCFCVRIHQDALEGPGISRIVDFICIPFLAKAASGPWDPQLQGSPLVSLRLLTLKLSSSREAARIKSLLDNNDKRLSSQRELFVSRSSRRGPPRKCGH